MLPTALKMWYKDLLKVLADRLHAMLATAISLRTASKNLTNCGRCFSSNRTVTVTMSTSTDWRSGYRNRFFCQPSSESILQVCCRAFQQFPNRRGPSDFQFHPISHQVLTSFPWLITLSINSFQASPFARRNRYADSGSSSRCCGSRPSVDF